MFVDIEPKTFLKDLARVPAAAAIVGRQEIAALDWQFASLEGGDIIGELFAVLIK